MLVFECFVTRAQSIATQVTAINFRDTASDICASSVRNQWVMTTIERAAVPAVTASDR